MSLTDRINALDGSMQTRFGETNAAITSLSSQLVTLDGSITNQFEATNLAIAQEFQATNVAIAEGFEKSDDLFLRAEIERALLEGTRLAIYYLPADQGGHLELVREIVTETIARVEASGESAYHAPSYLNSAITQHDNGQYKYAFNFYSKAYFDAVKRNGERQ